MSLETEIVSLTAAVKALTEAVKASTFAAPADAEPVTITYTPEVQQAAAAVVARIVPEQPKTEAVAAPTAAPAEQSPVLTPPAAPTVTRDELRELAKLKMKPAGMSAKVKQAVLDYGVASITACPDDKLDGLKKVLEAL